MDRLNDAQVSDRLKKLSGWERKGDTIRKVFSFKNYYETMAFVNATAWISHREDHHPDLEVGYNKCTISYSTHSAGGVTEKDFECAGKIETLMKV
jgi:4a-hydroxytetrahydrobiopterin dehydratase